MSNTPTITTNITDKLPPAETPLTATQPFRLGALLLIVVFFLIYAVTLDTGLQPHELHGGDLITHQYAQVQARPSNAPGYPLYTMGGWLWFHGWHTLLSILGQPFPNPIPILSSYSTVWALLALGLLYAILGELLGKSHQPRLATLFCLLTTAFFGVTYFFWYYATTTEQYSSAVAQTLAIVYLYLQWDKTPARRSKLYWLAFLCGISLAHMLTVAFIVPPLVVVILWRDPSLLRTPRAILFAILAAALPLTSYLYVYVRGALHPAWWGRGYWPTPQAWFWSFISTAQGRDELAWAFEPGRSFFGNGFPQMIWHELSLPLLMLGVVGIAFLPRRHAFMLYGTLVIYVIFCWLYRFGNWFQVILPAYPLILLGLVPLYGSLGRISTTSARIGRYGVTAALTLALLWRAQASLPAANSRDRTEDTALDHAAILLDQPLPRNARLFAAVDDTLALNYLIEIWGIRPDIKTMNSHDANDDLREDKKVYATVDATPALMGELAITPTLDGFSADWLELSTSTPITAQQTLTATPIYTVTPSLILAAYHVQPAPTGQPLSPTSEPAIDVRLTWLLPSGDWPPNLSISLRPTAQGALQVDPAAGQPIQQDRPRPLNGLWLDSLMDRSPQQPVVIHDNYRLPQPTTLAAPADGLLLILYTAKGEGFANIAEISLPLNNH
jgi:hypothetical protein